MTDDQPTTAPLIPPVGEDDPLPDIIKASEDGTLTAEMIFKWAQHPCVCASELVRDCFVFLESALTLTRQQQAEQIKAAAHDVSLGNPIPCGLCGGPCEFDTVVPSVVWNDVIRAQGLPEYLCAACIIRQFAKAGVSFTCELWGAEFDGLPVAVHFNSRRAWVSKKVSAENTDLRHRLSEAERGCQKLAEQIAEKDRKMAETFIDIVFDGPPDPHSPSQGHFVEVETAEGKSIRVGEWLQRPDGYWVLRLESREAALGWQEKGTTTP